MREPGERRGDGRDFFERKKNKKTVGTLGYPVARDEGRHLGGLHALSTILLAVIASTFDSFARLCRVASLHVPWTRVPPLPCGRLPRFCVPVSRSNLVRLDICPDLGNLRKGARDY